MENEYLAKVYDGDEVIHEIPCTGIFMNNVGGTEIKGYIKEGVIGWETTLAVIPSTLTVIFVGFHPSLQIPKEIIEE